MRVLYAAGMLLGVLVVALWVLYAAGCFCDGFWFWLVFCLEFLGGEKRDGHI